MQDGKITYNSPSALSGLYLIGLNKDNLLVVKDIDGMSARDFESYVNEAGSGMLLLSKRKALILIIILFRLLLTMKQEY